MKRNVVEPVNASIQKYKWKKNGGGSLRILGRIIKPGEIFHASMSEIPESFRNTVTLLDDVAITQAALKPVTAVKTVFLKRPNEEEEGMFDVVREKKGKPGEESTFKALNDVPLTEEKADEFLKNLQ